MSSFTVLAAGCIGKNLPRVRSMLKAMIKPHSGKWMARVHATPYAMAHELDLNTDDIGLNSL
jgi:hypothetical protein